MEETLDVPGSTPKLQGSRMTSAEESFRVSPTMPVKRKRDEMEDRNGDLQDNHHARKGTVPIKREYLVNRDEAKDFAPRPGREATNDDAAEAFHHRDRQPESKNSRRREKNQGQNRNRRFGSSRDEVGLCSTRVTAPEFSPEECQFGDKCKFEHDLRKYLSKYKREDLATFDRICPVWALRGRCHVGWKCRFVGSHSRESTHEDGKKELVLVEVEELVKKYQSSAQITEADVANVIDVKDRILLTKKKFATPKSDAYLKLLDEEYNRPKDQVLLMNGDEKQPLPAQTNDTQELGPAESELAIEPADARAEYKEERLRPSEKRRIYFGAETPVLAPLTTQGNLPFRRLCTMMGATFTYSEMAMSLPLLQGHKPEWALIKAHESEVAAPTFTKKNTNLVYDYDQTHDIRFGAQIAANKPWVAVKATEALTTLLPRGLRLVDLNVGCPIDLVYREGAGSALMDSPAKLEKILRGMNAVSGDVPITCKIRMGTKDKVPTAQKLVDRLVIGLGDGSTTPSGVAAITLHGRSRQQRYTRQADWEYIAETAALIKTLNAKADTISDTIREADERDLPNRPSGSKNKVFFLGNGDVYSHIHYNQHIEEAGVDSVMVARGALIKPWIFEEIQSGQYLDKSASERLGYVEKFCRYGLEAWGSDEIGVGQTRRFLLEWLSFACRYVPIGLLEHLPPSIQDRPPRYRGRDDLETLMASDNYLDWIKLSEMFLGPAHKDFRFEPKHKSNSYEIEAEG